MTSHREALEVEREGYVRRGLKARVAQVDDALAALKPAPVSTGEDAQVGVERAVQPSPRKAAARKPRS